MARILGIVVLVVGLLLLVFGLNSSCTVTEKVVEGVTGRFTDNTMWYIIAGAAMSIGGLALTLFKRV